MSTVALNSKRRYDEYIADPQRAIACQERHIAFLRSPVKRARVSVSGLRAESSGTTPVRGRSPSHFPSDLPVGSSSSPLMEDDEMFQESQEKTSGGKRAFVERCAERLFGNSRERTVSRGDVEAAVEETLSQYEFALREEYERILQEKLTEQFASFQKFNEDYVSRQLRQSQHTSSYVS